MYLLLIKNLILLLLSYCAGDNGFPSLLEDNDLLGISSNPVIAANMKGSEMVYIIYKLI